MATQNVSSTSRVHQTLSASISADSGRSKRARTKHACDECRRSQKKCDGEKPLCRRCHLNGTQCTYTPHKSRSQCVCAGQSADDVRLDAPVPDVFIFPNNPSLSSSFIWPTTSSPNQSPSRTESGLDTPSPAHLNQDEIFEAVQSSGFPSAVTPSQTQHNYSSPKLQRNTHLYSQRSYSVPNFSRASAATACHRTTSFSPSVAPSSLPHYPVERVSMTSSAHATHTAHHANIDLGSSPAGAYNEPLLPLHAPDDIDSVSIFDFAPQHVLDMELGHRLSAVFSSESSSFPRQTQQPYRFQQAHLDHRARDSFDLPSATSSVDMDLSSNSNPDFIASQVPVGPENTATTMMPFTQASLLDTRASSQNFRFEQNAQSRHDGRVGYLRPRIHASEISPSFAESRSSEGMPLNLSPPHFSQSPSPWPGASELQTITSPPSRNCPSSAYPSPNAYDALEYYDWSQ
ncbi:hypothetical protein DFH11DRAFT_1621409 [Phellopilus nigrolimitatus]|nr:hypothetical protein DFH11DRAFT_1621409 [Phellopilus nigrolimitatus]